MQKFCYKCGALEGDRGQLIDGLCQLCFVEENPLLDVTERISLRICDKCGAYSLNKGWQKPEIKSRDPILQAATEAVLSEIKVARRGPTGIQYVRPHENKGLKIELEPELIDSDVRVRIRAQGRIHGSQLEEQVERREVEVVTNKTTCNVCSRRISGYYEAVLQVRGEVSLSEEMLSELTRKVDGYIEEAQKLKSNFFVTKIERKHGGLDFYISSASFAKDMAKFLKSEYGGEVGESAKLVGVDRDGRDKYRVAVVVRLSQNS